MKNNGCGCILAQPVATVDTLKLDSLGKLSLAYLQQQDTMHFYFANQIIEFYTDSSVLSYLQHLKTYLLQAPTRKIALYGYADPKGNAEDNYQLAQKRLQTVERCLLQLGISSQQITNTAKGEIGYCADSDEFCLKKYRRVDAVLE